jgi:hypothetical protein
MGVENRCEGLATSSSWRLKAKATTLSLSLSVFLSLKAYEIHYVSPEVWTARLWKDNIELKAD